MLVAGEEAERVVPAELVAAAAAQLREQQHPAQPILAAEAVVLVQYLHPERAALAAAV
jgi:hypothetical protein